MNFELQTCLPAGRLAIADCRFIDHLECKIKSSYQSVDWQLWIE